MGIFVIKKLANQDTWIGSADILLNYSVTDALLYIRLCSSRCACGVRGIFVGPVWDLCGTCVGPMWDPCGPLACPRGPPRLRPGKAPGSCSSGWAGGCGGAQRARIEEPRKIPTCQSYQIKKNPHIRPVTDLGSFDFAPTRPELNSPDGVGVFCISGDKSK